jgi:TM2 domain-containing membrane protein YozV
MGIPASLNPVFEKLSPEAQISVRRDYHARKKSMLFAYLAWFFFGWHYLYLRRTGLQIAFWLTFGGFLIWWCIDLFRVAGLVNRMNEDTARELMVQYKALNS